jgi:excisionase family DNA binding protein
MLSVSTETVLRWVRAGMLPALRLPGGAIRFRQTDLDGWLEERATPRGEEVSATPQGRRPGGRLALSATPEDEEE